MNHTVAVAMILLLSTAVADDRGPGSAAKPAEHVLSGVVVDTNGQPVPQADVWLIGSSFKVEPEVQAHLRTDQQGRFSLPVPERWFARLANQTNTHAVCAWKDGTQLAHRALPQRSIPPADNARLVLHPPKPAVLHVHDPAGNPAAGVRVRIKALLLESGLAILPDELSARLAFTTDDRGEGALTAVAPDQIAWVVLEAEDFGQQQLMVPPADGWTSPIVLGPVGRLTGRLTAPDPQLVAGLTVDVLTYTFNEHGGQTALGQATVTTDAEGRFEIPAIRHGVLITQVAIAADTPWRARTTQSKQELLHLATDWAISGEHTQIEIPLEPAVRVAGIVREQGTDQPVPGVAVQISSGAGWNQVARSEDDGRFTLHMLPGQVLAFPHTPCGWFAAQPNIGILATRKGAQAVELPPIELLRAVAVRGRVVDDQSQPVAGATVRAVWNASTERMPSTPEEAQVTTNDEGEFTVEGVHPHARLGLRAKTDDAVTEHMLQWQPTAQEPLTLTISEAHWLRPGGRVMDSTGAPVAGATVTVWEQIRSAANPHDVIERPLQHQPAIRTDEQGRFTDAPRLERYGFFRAEATAPSFGTVHTEWIAFSQLEGGFPPIVLEQRIDVSGRVVDAQGRSVPGASVTVDNGAERRTLTTDAEGRFQVQGVPAGLTFLFARKSGYRLVGQVVPADGEVTLTLYRSDEPGAPVMKASPPALSLEERSALARQLIEPLLKPGTDEHLTIRAAEILALIDPAAALEWLEAEPEKPLEISMMTRMTAAQRLATTDPDEALLVGESIADPMWRGKVYLDVCDALPASARARKLEMLSEAVLNARGSENPTFRAFLMGQVAERLLDLGETEPATKLLREGEQIAREFPAEEFAGYVRGAFAEELAQIDLAAALKLTKDLKDEFEFNRHHGNIAHELAGKQPAEAVRVLDLVKSEGTQYIVQPRDQYLVRVCYRMAPVDLDRARRLADSARDPCQRAYARGMMAQSLAAKDATAAADLLREAFQILSAHVEAGEDHFNYVYSASTVAGALLPVAESIDPALLAELFCETLALRLLPKAADGQALADLSNTSLAMFVAVYDRHVARALLLGVGSQARRNESWLRAMALIDPRAAVEHVQNLPTGDDILKNQQARDAQTVARILAVDGEELRRELLDRTSLWVADTEDL